MALMSFCERLAMGFLPARLTARQAYSLFRIEQKRVRDTSDRDR